MDPEQTFLRVHARLSGMLSQLLTPRIRLVLEYAYLAVAVVLFCLLVVMHINFVQQPGCSTDLSGINFTEAQLFQIKITSDELWAQISAEQNLVNSHKQGKFIESTENPDVNGEEFTFLSTKFWSHWFGSSARRSKLIFKSWRSEKELIEVEPKELAITAREAIKTALLRFFSSWNDYDFSHWKITNKLSDSGNRIQKSTRWKAFFDISKLSELLHIEHMNPFLVQWFERRSRAFEPTYLYTSEKGYFRLSEEAKARHNIRTINITISAENSCFGNRWQKLLINGLVGYDTILMNSLLSYPGQGYLYNYQTKELYDLNYGYESPEPARFGGKDEGDNQRRSLLQHWLAAFLVVGQVWSFSGPIVLRMWCIA